VVEVLPEEVAEEEVAGLGNFAMLMYQYQTDLNINTKYKILNTKY